MITDTLSVAFNLARFVWRFKPGFKGACELASLCALAMVRADSPTGKMFLGQAKGAAKRLASGQH